MKRFLWAIAVLGAALAFAGRAEASLVQFDFSYSGTNVGGGPVSGSGYLFGTDIGGGTYLLTGGYGTSSEAGNLTLGPAGTYINTYPPSVNLTSDNLLTPASNPVLDGNGLVFAGSNLPPTSRISTSGATGRTATRISTITIAGPSAADPSTVSR